MAESWHIPRALSDEALRLLTVLPMEEVERRLRIDGPAASERPTDEELLRTYGLAKRNHNYEGSLNDWAAVVAGLRAVLTLGSRYDGARLTSDQCRRAADLLERQALRPIPVSERLPGPEVEHG